MAKILINGTDFSTPLILPPDHNNNRVADGTWFGKTRYRRSFEVDITNTIQKVADLPSNEIIVGCNCFYYGDQNAGISNGGIPSATMWQAVLHKNPQNEIVIYGGSALTQGTHKAYVTIWTIEA